jgi:hypothetical protein
MMEADSYENNGFYLLELFSRRGNFRKKGNAPV